MLDDAAHGVLVFADRGEPLLVPVPLWSDGGELWLTLAADSRETNLLRRQTRTTLAVQATDGSVSVVTGASRAFGLHDPIGLAVHSPVIAVAMAALAATHAGSVADYLIDGARVPGQLPRARVAVKVPIEDVHWVAALPAPAGVAPALPTVVPASIRRSVAGRHQVVLATLYRAHLEVGPAVWAAGFKLTVPPGRVLDIGAVAGVYVQAEASDGRGTMVGLVLTGPLGPGGVLRPEKAMTWSGLEHRSVDVPAARPGIVLPD